MRCACGDAVLASESDKVTLTSGNHHFSFCLGHSGHKESKWWRSEDDKFKASAAALQGAAEIATAMSAEQKSYRAGWEEGNRQAAYRLWQLNAALNRIQENHEKALDALRKESFDLSVKYSALLQEKQMRESGEDLDEGDDKHWLNQDVDLREENADLKRLRDSLAYANRKVSEYQKENATLAHKTRVLFDELEAERNKEKRNVYPPAYMSDLNSTKAHLDKPYWAEGIDPDEP